MIALYPGTFDPLTRSHSEIMKRAASIFERLIVAVAADTSKNTLFSLEDRVAMMQTEIDRLDNKNIIVMPFHGLLVKFAAEHRVKVIVRGLRALSDFEYEFKMAYMNKKLNESIETIFIPATEKENFISSSFVKEIARLGGDISSLVPPHVEHKINSIVRR
jgi:pantetheine-phosphate adenylyltransferase